MGDATACASRRATGWASATPQKTHGEDGNLPKGPRGGPNAPIVPVLTMHLLSTKNKAQTYGKALVVLASLLCLSVCGNLATSALTILVVKESRTRGAIQPVVLSDSKAAAPVGTGLTPYGTVASRPPPPPPRQRDSLSAERLRLDSAVATPPPPSDDSLSQAPKHPTRRQLLRLLLHKLAGSSPPRMYRLGWPCILLSTVGSVYSLAFGRCV